jgi:3-hydroxybutyryl-CoA dehydrogenase
MTTRKVAVIGCGTMGRGIIEACALAGVDVTAIKVTPGKSTEPAQMIRDALARRVKRGKLTSEQAESALARISFSDDIRRVCEGEIVIESVVEVFETKRDVLLSAEKWMHVGALLATNTSSLRIDTLAANLVRPSHFLGLHFFNPVPVMELVEVAGTPTTDARVLERANRFCQQIGKTPVTVAATPGYAVNRLLTPYLLHAIDSLERGVADATAIDSAMKLGCGHPMGPLALADLIGLDVLKAMAIVLAGEFGESRYNRPRILDELVAANELGRKTGRGIYDYRGAEPIVNSFVVNALEKVARERQTTASHASLRAAP